jgi:hypothetical protein
MAAVFEARWGLAMILAAMSAVAAIVAVVFIASPAFTETTDSYVRVCLTGAVLLFTFPIVSTVLVAAAAVITVALMRRAERRTAVAA